MQVSHKTSILSSLLIENLDNYARAYYWSIIETNTGILSACLPTFRPLIEAYSLSPVVYKLAKHVNNGLGSLLRRSKNARLDSMESGLTEVQSKALGAHQSTSHLEHEGSKPGPQHPATILLNSTLSSSLSNA